MKAQQTIRRARLLASLLLIAVSAHAWGAPAPTQQSLYSFSLVKPGGALVPLANYKGKVVVIVNLASQSTFADQLRGLEKLQQQYADKGLVVLGVPSNDFGGEEPGSDAEIEKFYAGEHLTFPVMAKAAVCGKDELPLYGFLVADGHRGKGKGGDKEPPEKNQVHWSFTKFIVTRDGHVGARFEPDVAPDSPEFQIAIDKALVDKLKAGSKPAPGAGDPGDGDDDDDGGL